MGDEDRREALLPCPFCGTEAEEWNDRIQCTAPGCPVWHYDADRWNNRADLLDRLEGVGEPVQRIIQLAYEAQRADGEARSGDCGAALEELARIFRENPDLHP